MESTPATVLKRGEKVRVTVEKVAHGGHFIARHDAIVIFVRHAIPGEDVTVEITDVTKNFARADVVEIHQPSEDRVSPPCPFAGECGGCDFQHISIERQRDLKSDVIHEQFARLAKEDLRIPVEECGPSLGWRVRATATANKEGKLGFYRYRSNVVLPVSDCIVLHPSLKYREKAHERYEADEKVRFLPTAELSLQLSESSFWQGHVNAPTVLTEALLSSVEIREGDHIFDLYGGVGLFTSALIEKVGAGGRIDLIESNRHACVDAEKNFEENASVHIHRASVEKALPRFKRADVVVLDPPREGAGERVIDGIIALNPRAIAYVACDPASLARDTVYLRDGGYKISKVRAFDLFPMTHHIELIAVYQRDGVL